MSDTYEEVLEVLEEIEDMEKENIKESKNSKKKGNLEEVGASNTEKKEEIVVKTTNNNKKTQNNNEVVKEKEEKSDNIVKKTQEQNIEGNEENVSKKPEKNQKKEEKSMNGEKKTQKQKEQVKKEENTEKKEEKKDKDKNKELPPKPPVPGKENMPPVQKTSISPSKTSFSTSSPGVVTAPIINNSKITQLETEIKALKDANKEFSEKIEGFSERIGEIRGLVMERETTLREALISLKKMGEVVSELDPAKLIKDKRKMKAEITIMQSKLDEYEKLMKDMSKKFSQAKEMIKAVSDIHVILELGKDVGKRLQEMEEIKVKIERMLHQIESMYSEINKKFEQLPYLIGKIEKFDALSMEMMKILDEYKIKMESFLVNEDLNPIRTEINMIKEELQEIEQRATRRPLSVKESNELESYKKMIEDELEAITATNSIIEEQYREAMISERTFNELTKKNRERESALKILLKDINSILEKGLVEDIRFQKLMDILKKLSKKK